MSTAIRGALACRFASLGAACLALLHAVLPGEAAAQISTNGHVSPCINTSVLAEVEEGVFRNICTMSSGSLSFHSMIVGTSFVSGTGHSVFVGQGAGSLSILGGRQLTLQHGLQVSDGTVRVSGAGSTLNASPAFFSPGTLLTLQSGALFKGDGLFLADATVEGGSRVETGSLSVDGSLSVTGSSVEVRSATTALLSVDSSSAETRAELKINAGGSLTFDAPQSLFSMGAQSYVEVSGQDARLQISGLDSAGFTGSAGTAAELKVKDGGRVELSGRGWQVGAIAEANTNGSILIEPGGSFSLTRNMSVDAEPLFMTFGNGPGGKGTLHVTGDATAGAASFSMEGANAELHFGQHGEGIGKVSGNRASVSVKGRDAELWVGVGTASLPGSGTLDVLGGASLALEGSRFGIGGLGATGTVTVTGSSVLFKRDTTSPTTPFLLEAGFGPGGKGRLTLDGRASLSMIGDDAELNIGTTGGEGHATVHDAGTSLLVSGKDAAMAVGRGGGAPAGSTLLIGGDGKAELVGSWLEAGFGGGTGSVKVWDGGILSVRRHASNTLSDFYIAFGLDEGSLGSLHVDAGGTASVEGAGASLYTGGYGGVGHVTVSGAGAALSILGSSTGGVFVGQEEDGQQASLHSTLTVTGGGKLTASARDLVVGDTGGAGRVTVSGSGSTFTFTTDHASPTLAIGRDGRGELHVAQNGKVTISGSQPANARLLIGQGGELGTGDGKLFLSEGGVLTLKEASLAGGVNNGVAHISVGRTASLEVAARRELPIALYQGTIDVSPSANLKLTVLGGGQEASAPAIAPAKSGTGSPGATMTLTTGAAVTLSAPDWNAVRPGQTLSFALADRIQEAPGLLATRASGNTVQFDTAGVTRASGLAVRPETLRVGCEGFAADCGSDVLAVRTVRENVAGQSGAGRNTTPLLTEPDASQFIKEARTVTAANHSNAIYSVPNAFTAREISHIDLGGLRAYAVSGNGEITIAIRGTEFTSGADWATNLGFAGAPTDMMRSYVQNLSQFTASVMSANPTADVRFTGHSLGGGLAMLMGVATGFDAYAFNAPAIGALKNNLSTLALELSPLTGTSGFNFGNGNFYNLVNIRTDGDAVSALPLGHLGHRISVAPTAFEYAMENQSAVCAVDARLCAVARQVFDQYYDLKETYSYHKMKLLLAQLVDPKTEALSLEHNGVELFGGPFVPNLDEFWDYVLIPDVSGGLRSFADQAVSALAPYFLDPELQNGLVFTSDAGSPLFQSIMVPDLGIEDLLFSLEVLQDGDWVQLALLEGLEEFTFDEAVAQFRLMLDGELPEGIEPYFQVTFASGGVFNGSIATLTPIPEPHTYALLLVGLGLLAWRARRKSCS